MIECEAVRAGRRAGFCFPFCCVVFPFWIDFAAVVVCLDLCVIALVLPRWAWRACVVCNLARLFAVYLQSIRRHSLPTRSSMSDAAAAAVVAPAVTLKAKKPRAAKKAAKKVAPKKAGKKAAKKITKKVAKKVVKKVAKKAGKKAGKKVAKKATKKAAKKAGKKTAKK